MAQKRANVGKIGGGSQQLLAGMSGNAWDWILKARPRQSPAMPLRGPLFCIGQGLTGSLTGDHGGSNEIVIASVDRRCSKFVWLGSCVSDGGKKVRPRRRMARPRLQEGASCYFAILILDFSRVIGSRLTHRRNLRRSWLFRGYYIDLMAPLFVCARLRNDVAQWWTSGADRMGVRSQ